MQDEAFYGLIASLHDGVADDAQWMAALDQLSDAFGSAAIFLGSTRRDGTFFELSGHRVDPQWSELVNGSLAGHDANPIFSVVSSALRADPIRAVMRPFVLSSLIDLETYHQSPIYRLAMAPAGHEHVLVIVLHAEAQSALSLTLARPGPAGDFGPECQDLATAVGPHLLSALRLRHQFAIARSGSLLLDRFDRAVFLLSAKSKLVSGNVRAQRLLDAKDGLVVIGGELRADRPEHTTQLQQAIQETDRAGRGTSLHPRAILRLPRPSGRPDLVVRASPVAPSVASTFGAGDVVTVALFVHDPEDTTGNIEYLIADGLGLSPAEAAVAARIWEGDSVADAAKELNVSPNTVKTHLKAIFEKTSVDRQSALVRKIALTVASLTDD